MIESNCVWEGRDFEEMYGGGTLRRWYLSWLEGGARQGRAVQEDIGDRQGRAVQAGIGVGRWSCAVAAQVVSRWLPSLCLDL